MNVKFFSNWSNMKRETERSRKKEFRKGAALLAAAALVFNMYPGGVSAVHAQEQPVLEPETELVSPGEHAARIHFISLYGWTDAILLESDGHFGLIDGGEDWDYPTEMRYLTRSGITDYIGYEQQVIHYLQKAGVQKLDFMIGTHSHSDHIGSGDEIIEAIPTDRLYIQKYDDSFLRGYDGASKFDERYDYANMTGGLWDNQKNYDELIDEANKRGTQIITDLDLEENKDSRIFSLGQMNIELMNCERDRDEAGEIIPVVDDNANSLGILVSAFDRYAFLAGDMMPTEKNSDMVRNANLLYEKLKDVPTQKYEEKRSEPTADTVDGTSVSMLSIEDDTTVIEDTQDVGEGTNDTGTLEENEEFEPTDKMENTTHRISIDLLKLPHHGSPYNNTPYFLTTLNPKNAVVTGFLSTLDDRMRTTLVNTDMYATGTDSASVLADFSLEGIRMQYGKLIPDWFTYQGRQYYMNDNGRPFLDRSWHEVDGQGFYTDRQGAVAEGISAVKVNDEWKLWSGKGKDRFLNNGWNKTNYGVYFAKPDGTLAVGWQNIGGKWYYFNTQTAEMAVKPQRINERIYDFSATGEMQTGWQYIEDKWYYFTGSGEAVKGWQYIGGKWYYMSPLYNMTVGWQNDGGSWYYMNSSGEMQANGWKYIDGNWYYLLESGKAVSGWLRQGDTWYYMNESGAMTTGWVNVSGKWYYMNGSGAMQTGWLYSGGSWYYLTGSGEMAIGWVYVGKTWYYMNESGAMTTGWVNVSGKWYYMNGSGAMQTGWLQSGGSWYYLTGSGEMAVGWVYAGKTWYYMNESGVMTTGWVNVSGTWYYMNGSGAMQTGWLQSSGKWYYLTNSGAMAVSTKVGSYRIGDDGAWIP